jgi:hypothetical protein
MTPDIKARISSCRQPADREHRAGPTGGMLVVSDHHATNESPHASARLLRAALAIAERGYHLFPCPPGGKPPALRWNWKDLSTTDPAQISTWWAERPYNIGIDCGKSRLVVIDLDVPGHHHGRGEHSPVEETDRGTGLDGLAEICEREGQPFPGPTFTVSTPSGGYHLYYEAPKTPVGISAGRLRPLIDVRGDGGYIIAPGSLIGGRPYAVLNATPPQPMPAWLATLLARPKPLPRTEVPRITARPDDGASAYGRAALTAEAETVARTRRQRHITLNRAAFNLGQLIAAGLLTEAEVTRALTAAAAQTGLPEREITRTIRGGMAAGERSPRQAPPPARTPELQLPRQRSQGPLPHR